MTEINAGPRTAAAGTANEAWVNAIIADMRAMDKVTKGSMSDDLVAFARLMKRRFDEDQSSVPEHLRNVLVDTMLERMCYFGTFWSASEHGVLGPLLIQLVPGDDPEKRKAEVTRRFAQLNTEKERARTRKVA